ncbi:hypothetical protein [Marinomonas transparens]|uniref:Uncharacterized protein n=1 Tax=Marinomonas transparens TaxID=2795388 RepID=A0A934JN02_9GAMM|nr:hypothetical protein [Marinomonas transparens]MBJ7536984.1 hypothetical protein [Marinomonas transparens]
MTTQPTPLKKPQSMLFSFTTTELNVLKLIAHHWQKMYVCHEIDRGEVAGYTFLTLWSPEFTIQKLTETPSFKTDSISSTRYELGEFGAQVNAPLCRWELEMLATMVRYAVEGRLNCFLLLDKGRMNDVIGPYLTQSWTCNSGAAALANKVDLLGQVAGLFEGHSSYESAMAYVRQYAHSLMGVENV